MIASVMPMMIRSLTLVAREKLGPSATAEEVGELAKTLFKNGCESIAEDPAMRPEDRATLASMRADNEAHADEREAQTKARRSGQVH